MKKLLNEFKEFALKGNMLDLAIGIMIGGAFSTVVNSIVNDMIMPVIGIIIGGRDFTSLKWVVGTAEIKYGMFIQNIINFLTIAVCMFAIVKFINKLKKLTEKPGEPVEAAAPEKPADILLLEEIRDSLSEIKNK